MTILIQHISHLVRDPEHIERDCDLLIEGSRIRAIGKHLPVPPDAERMDGKGCVVMPGLINAHTHLYQNFLKGIAPGIALLPWCNVVLFPTVGALRGAMAKGNRRVPYLWTAAATIEMIRGGTTCCINMDTTTRETMSAWKDAGFRGVMAYTLTNRWVPADLRTGEEDMRRKVLAFVEEFHRPDERSTVFMAPSTLFLCTDEFLSWAGEQARRLDLGIQIHISEIASEVEDVVKETGHRPVEHLEHLGILENRLSAVHCVHLDQKEVALLAKSGASAVHCPKSNMKLADGIAPVALLRTAGIPVSVGTDGCASNDLLDMWEEMRTAVLLSRVAEKDASALNPKDAFRMATVDAARAARIDAGELQPGKLADIAILDLKSAHLRPFHADDLLNMLVFCGCTSDVRDTIIHGEVVMRNRTLTRINEESILREAEEVEAPLLQQRSNYPYP
jgi:5-methylthioadenosine/S-adenosylhomocysteine deaminase